MPIIPGPKATKLVVEFEGGLKLAFPLDTPVSQANLFTWIGVFLAKTNQPDFRMELPEPKEDHAEATDHP